MDTYQFGQIVLLSFPFTDGKTISKRPALILSDTGDEDIIVCRITSSDFNTVFDIKILASAENGLKLDSAIRIHKLATLEKRRVDRIIGKVEKSYHNGVVTIFKKLIS